MKIPNITISQEQKIPMSVKLMNIRHYNSHCHNTEVELLYCLSGQLDIIDAHMHMNVQENEIVLIDREDIHFAYSDENNMILAVNIDLSAFPEYEQVKYFLFSCATKICKPHQFHAMNLIIDTLLAAGYMKYSHESFSNDVKMHLCKEFYNMLINEFSWFAIENLTNEENRKYKDRLEGIMRYVQDNYNKKITISQLAKMYYINENYLSQFLRRSSFGSFSKLLQYMRCYKAEHLLLLSDISIQQISDICGFSSVKYFHRYFKELWGTTPFRHKKLHREFSDQPEEFYEYDKDIAFTEIRNHIALRRVNNIINEL